VLPSLREHILKKKKERQGWHIFAPMPEEETETKRVKKKAQFAMQPKGLRNKAQLPIVSKKKLL
jgi:hypothetical protein